MAVYEFETAMFYDRQDVEDVLGRLRSYGFENSDIGVVLDEKTSKDIAGDFAKTNGSEGVAAGATIGGILGAILAGLTATGSIAAVAATGGLAAPLVVGPLAAALAGLGTGAVGGGIVGGLIGLGVGEKRAKEYEQGLSEGGILIAVRPRSDEERAQIRRAFNSD